MRIQVRWIAALLIALGGVARSEVNLRDLQAALEPVVELARKSTVAVIAGDSTGSGVVVSPEGLILTASHVVTTNMDTGEVAEEVSIIFDDGDERRARVLGMNRTYDAAMVQLIGEGPWDFSPVGSSTLIRPGDWVLATGHPAGYDALRDAPVRFGRVISKNIDFFFGSDCVLFGGDSGGPLFDLDGKVVGIHSWIGDNIQINTHAGVSGFLNDWETMKAGVRKGELKSPPRMQEGKPILGVAFDRGNSPVILETVLADSPAEAAGLLPDDEVLRLDGKRVNGDTFGRYLSSLNAGDEVVLEIRRGSLEFISRVKLGRVTALPFVTERGQKILEQQAGELFEAFGDVTGELGSGAVRVYGSDGAQLAFGTVWRDGSVLTKLSEVREAEGLRGTDSDGREFGLRVRQVFAPYDLVVLEVADETELSPILAREGAVSAGTLIAAVRPDGVPEGIGVISVRDRNLLESSRGFLGVVLEKEYRSGGARVTEVTNGSAAQEAGVRAGDIIYRVDDRLIDGFEELKTILSRAGPDQEVNLTVRRPTGEVSIVATLKGNPFREMGPDRRQRMMNEMDERGLSEVRTRFPKVMQSDITIAPNECGLPVVDIQGRLTGILIARAGRVKTYLLSVETLSELIQ